MDLKQIPELLASGTELVAGMRVSSRGVKIKIEMAAIGDFLPPIFIILILMHPPSLVGVGI